jgi:hypothetical protein
LSTSISPDLVHICAEQPGCLSTAGDNSWVRPVDKVGTPNPAPGWWMCAVGGERRLDQESGIAVCMR